MPSPWPQNARSDADEAIIADLLLGGGLPEEAERELALAGSFYHADEIAERHLRAARAWAPDHPAVLIGFYRYYFYKGRLSEALEIAIPCLAFAARENRFVDDWRRVRAGDATFGLYESVLPRFFMFTLKGYAYLNIRLGRLDEGRAAVDKLLELDPSDKVGARVLLDVLQRVGLEDD